MLTLRPLGRTGEHIGALGFDGLLPALRLESRELARMIHGALEDGLSLMSTSWDYLDGEVDRRMGEALRGGYRDRAFLTTRIVGQTRGAAVAQLDQSLSRLRVEHVDLLLLNEIIRPEDPERIVGPGGALEALVEAKQAGKVRYLGIAGHKDPALLLAMLDHGFPFDAVQMPLNLLDAQFRSFEQEVLPLCVERGIGVLGVRPLAGGKLLETGRIKPTDALRYALSLPASAVIGAFASGADLADAMRLASGFTPMDPEEADFYRRKVADLAHDGRFEEYKTTDAHDVTALHPEWLTGVS